MEKVGVAVCSKKPDVWRGKEQFDGYIFEAGDADAQKKAEEWARRYDDRYDSTKETITYEPNVHIFDNEGFTVTILDSAGGSSQGGRLSFWKCAVEKDGIKFVVGINDGILADLIRHSTLEKGVVKEPVMFARQSGQPGFIHDGMESYTEAVADMTKKADMKKAKKTKKWEAGGIYQSLTQTSICLGEVYDHYEEATIKGDGWYRRDETKLVKRAKPVKTLAWVHVYRFENGLPKDFSELMEKELADRRYIYFHTGSPPARAKTGQLKVKEEDMKSLDKIYSLREDTENPYSYATDRTIIKGRFKRVK